MSEFIIAKNLLTERNSVVKWERNNRLIFLLHSAIVPSVLLLLAPIAADNLAIKSLFQITKKLKDENILSFQIGQYFQLQNHFLLITNLYHQFLILYYQFSTSYFAKKLENFIWYSLHTSHQYFYHEFNADGGFERTSHLRLLIRISCAFLPTAVTGNPANSVVCLML